MKILFLMLTLTLLLIGCGETSNVEVSGGTTNTVDVTVEKPVVGVTSGGSICAKVETGSVINDGECMTPLIIYLPGEYTFTEIKAQRDLTLYPYDTEEALFLGI